MDTQIDYTYKYARDFDENTPKLLEYLFNGGTDKVKIAEMIKQGLSLIEQKYDCSDFRIEIFTRILLGYKEVIGKEVEQTILNVLSKFPFEDQSCHSMCTWTENHQLIIDVSEYLLGSTYPENKFYKDKTGIDLASSALTRLNDWCEFIYKFGFSEFGSCNYYPETLGALGNIIEFSKDEKLRDKFKIILDLMCFDIFNSVTPDLTYNKATARAYVDNKINYYNYLLPHIKSLLGDEIKVNHEREACFFLMLKAKDKNGNHVYKLPQVFLDIFNTKERILKESNGLNGKEYRKHGLLKYEDKNVRYIMTSGTSGSYVALRNISKYLSDQEMWNHAMFKSVKPYKTIIKLTPFLFSIIRKLDKNNYNYTSYARGDTYTYVNNNYSVSSLTRYQVKKVSFQQVSHIINLDGLSVFTTAPAKTMDKTGSPDYWIGSKRNPDCMQFKNILIAYYKNPKLTHVYFPLEKFEEVNLDYLYKGFVFGRYHNINVMIRTNANLSWVDSTNDKSIKQDGKTPNFNLKQYDLMNNSVDDHYYIFEVDDTMTLKEFIANVLDNSPLIKEKEILYKGFQYIYNKRCHFNGIKMKNHYPRFESKFVFNDQYVFDKENPIIFVSDKNKLTIDFKEYTRKEETITK